jgi:hypothetical protein
LAARRGERAAVDEHCHRAFDLYHALTTKGWPRELARSVLPVSTYSRMFATANLLNLMRFLTLRCDLHAQLEIRVYADAMRDLARTARAGRDIRMGRGSGMTKRTKPAPTLDFCPPPGFNEFWQKCPLKVAKAKAQKEWGVAVKHVTPEAILRGLERHVFSADTKYRPHPATWLAQQRWDDEPAGAEPPRLPDPPAYLNEIPPPEASSSPGASPRKAPSFFTNPATVGCWPEKSPGRPVQPEMPGWHWLMWPGQDFQQALWNQTILLGVYVG